MQTTDASCGTDLADFAQGWVESQELLEKIANVI